MACSAKSVPSVAQTGTDEAKAGEATTTILIVPPQGRNDFDCYEPSAQTFKDISSYIDVERIKWRNPRTFRGYYYTNFEGGSFVAAHPTEHPDGLGDGRYQAELRADIPKFPSSVENQTYWIEFIGSEAMCNTQGPDDAKFDVPLFSNLLRVIKVIQQARVR